MFEKKFKSYIKNNRFLRILLIFIGFIFIVSIICKVYYNNQLKSVKSFENRDEIVILIPKGSSTKTIAKILEDNNLIKNELVFRMVAKYDKKEGNLKAGKYKLNNSMNIREILHKLENGGEKEETVKFTIPEGLELKQIAEKLSNEGLVDFNKFLELSSNIGLFKDDYEFIKEIENNKTLEGFLFPNTYEVFKNATEEDIIRKMLNEFNNVYLEYIKGVNYYSEFNLNNLITLASIIEREGKVDSERPIMAGVFFNRLKVNKKLESCATVQYILGERKVNLTYDDIKVDSPYNTYIYTGLPPHPIASPGLKSIVSTINPDTHDYLYFVLKKDGSGTHVFSTNYNDHLRAKNNN